jgi:Flp pilus assembly protein TadG
MAIWRRFGRDRKGAAAVEFALLAPVMITIYFGLVETSEAVLASRKADHVASAIGDLVAQSSGSVSSSDLDDIYAIGNTIMGPFTTSTLQMRISSLTPNATGTPVVTWSYSPTMGKLATGTTKTVPLTISSGDSVIMSEVTYTYNSPLKYVLKNALTFNSVFYMRPRQTSQISCTGC